VKPKPAQENWYHVAIWLHEFGQRLVTPRLQILEIFWVIGAEPHHHGKVADLGGVCRIHFPWLFPDFPGQNELFSLTNLFTRNTNVGFQSH